MSEEQFDLSFERGKAAGLEWASKIVVMAAESGKDPAAELSKVATAMNNFCDQQASQQTGTPSGP